MTPDPFRSGSSGSDDAFRTRPFEIGRDTVIPYGVPEPRRRTLGAADLLAAVGELALRGLPSVSDVTLVFWCKDALLAQMSTDNDLSRGVGAHDAARPGPVADVLREGGMVQLPDLECESRWPEAARALRVRGVRSCAAAALRRPRFSLALVVYSTVPGPLVAAVELDALLGDWVSAVMRDRVRGVT